MHASFTFKNIESSESLKAYAFEKLNRLDKYLDNPAEANVVLTVEKFRHIAEITIAGDRLTINGKEETGDMYSAIDMAADKLEKQIKKNKQKIRTHRGPAKSRSIRTDIEPEPESQPEEEPEGLDRVTVEAIEYKPMDVEEAILQFNLVNDPFLVFTNAKTGKVNVLYRRKGRELGLIEPSL